jgi:hypothetical protein
MEADLTSEDYLNCENGIQTESLDSWEEDLLQQFRSAILLAVVYLIHVLRKLLKKRKISPENHFSPPGKSFTALVKSAITFPVRALTCLPVAVSSYRRWKPF